MLPADPPRRETIRASPRGLALLCLLVTTLLVAGLSSWNLPKGWRATSEREFFDLLLFHDPYLYLHRVRLTLDDFPHAPFADRFIFAHGAGTEGHVVAAAPGFTLLVATWCHLLGVTTARVLAVARAAAPLVPILGALAVLLVFAAARVLAPASWLAPPCAALFLLAIPLHHFYAQYGQVDHHVVEPLVPGLVMLFALRAALGATRRPRLNAWLAGFLADVALWFWPGAFLPVAIVHAVLVALALVRGRQVVRLAFAMSLAAVVFAPILIPAMPSRWRVDVWTVSLLQPAIYLALCALWAAALGSIAASAHLRWIAAAIALVLAAALLITTRSSWQAGLTLLLRDDPVMAFVPEAQPLWQSAAAIWQYFGPHAALLPIALVALAWLASRDRAARARHVALLTWLAASAVLTTLQFRFSTYLPIPLAVALGVLAARVWCVNRLARAAVLAGLAVTLWLGIDRSIYCQAVGGEGDEVGAMLVQRESAFHESALSLRGEPMRFRLARPGSAPLPRPVAVELFFGDAVIALGERPVIACGLGNELESHYLNAQLFTLAEADVVTLCDREQVQYYLASELPPYLQAGYRRMAAERGPLPDQSLNERLMREMGAGSPGRRAVATWRAVFEPGERGWVRVFERVRGAVLPVATAPNVPVAIQVLLECGHGHKLAWQDLGHADQEGHLRLVLPYATSEPNGEIRAVLDYRLRVGANEFLVQVTNAQVVNGETVTGAQIRAGR